MALQTITNVRVNTFKAKKSEAGFKLTKGTSVACTAEIRGEDMYHFVSKFVDVVMPRFKDWSGVKGTSGDGSGNITFGMSPEMVALFPEIQVNYDM
jgi:large subunit ribosomal protein L5